MDAYKMAYELEAWAEQQGFVAPSAYYICGEFNLKSADGESVYSDEAHLWCKDCGTKLLAKAKSLLPAEKQEDNELYRTDATGEDTCPHCMACGETLDGTVSEYCVSEEVAHYREHPIGTGTINPRQAVEIAQILVAVPDDKDVLRIGRAACAARKRSATNTIDT